MWDMLYKYDAKEEFGWDPVLALGGFLGMVISLQKEFLAC